VCKVYRVLKVLGVRQVFKVCKVYRVLKVLGVRQVFKEQPA
jgi:hypothetical protein